MFLTPPKNERQDVEDAMLHNIVVKIIKKGGEDMSFVVFLDVDGVLNTGTTCQKAPSESYTGIDEMRVQILAGAMSKCRASGVVLTSTWKDLKPGHEDYIYLKEGLSKKGIEILGKTEDPHVYQRGIGVLNYLKEHPEIDEFGVNHFFYVIHQPLTLRYSTLTVA